jgi:hypothetical protein
MDEKYRQAQNVTDLSLFLNRNKKLLKNNKTWKRTENGSL